MAGIKLDESSFMKKIEQQETTSDSADLSVDNPADAPESSGKSSSILPVFLIVIVISAMTGAAYQGWLLFTQQQQQTASVIQQLKSELAMRPTLAQVDSGINSIRQSVSKTDSRLAGLEQGQQVLAGSTEKLYELYGRDENGWKLAEVEYLMSISQHKLVLENDFEGAAKTLNAANERIAELADPGLLQVRVKINEEIAMLKTRTRPDLVGMTLLVSRLTRQVSSLKPGYQTQIDKPASGISTKTVIANPDLPLQQKLMNFMTSLVTVKTSQPKAKKSVETVIIDVSEQLEDNLKLTRWSVLERDAFQYDQLMVKNVKLFEEYYDLKKADNASFYEALQKLQKSQIKPELPDITGSLRLLKEIQKKRESEPEQESQQEIDNG